MPSRDGLLDGLRVLRAGPDDHSAVAVIGDSGRRLHGCVRQVRHVVFGLDDLAAFRELGLHVAQVADECRLVARGLLERLFVLRRVVGGVGTVFPLDLERLAALEGRPGVVGDNRDSA